LATASGLRSILQRHLANAITTPSTFFRVSVRRSDTPRLTSGADPYRRRSTLNIPSSLPSWHVISSLDIGYSHPTEDATALLQLCSYVLRYNAALWRSLRAHFVLHVLHYIVHVLSQSISSSFDGHLLELYGAQQNIQS